MPTVMKAFEIHTFINGRWKIDSVFDDKELALFEAQRMDKSSRYSGVRVVEEAFDERSNKTSTRTIFRGTKATQANEKDLKAKTQARKTAEIDRRRKSARDAERRRVQLRKAKKKETNPYRLISILLLLVALGLGALYAIERLRHML